MPGNRWAELRQVGLATLDHTAAVRTATELLALGPGFGDPLLAALHLADFTAPVGPDTYLEVLAPTTPDHPVARWLDKVGGSSGWVLSTQVPSLDGVKERAADHGVRIAVETQAMGHDIIQLHPLDVGPRDPAAMARTWAAIVGIEPPVATADGAALAFGRRMIRFVPARGGRTGIVAVDVHATDREHGTGQQGMLCHTMINFI